MDLISRQAAIDAVKDRYVLSKLKTKQPLIYEDTDIIEILEQLPSAQPEIIRCKDCKYYDGRPCGIVDWYNTADDFCSSAERRTDDEG